jgi:hypothetical protein
MKKQQTLVHLRLLGLLFFLFSHRAHAQQDSLPIGLPSSIFDRLSAVEGAKLTLETDLTTIIANKKTAQYFPGTLSDEAGNTYKIELRSRGKYRRKIAEIPPLKIKFKKKDLKAEGLDTLNEIKLVLPCYDNALGDQLIAREYAAYRMFERLSGASLRARLIRLTIRDTHVEKSKKTMLAMLVEDEEELCARLKGTPVEEYGIPADSFITHQAALVSMFQYMIGNTDWETAMIRNVRLVRAPESGKVLVVPYDFDFSGLVSAPYSSPASDTGLKTVRDRFLMSNGLRSEALKKATQVIKMAKDDLLDLCRSKFLSRKSTEDMEFYLGTFFDQLERNDELPRVLKMPETD